MFNMMKAAFPPNEHDDDCFCDEPTAPEEATHDKELPEAVGGVQDDDL